MMDTTISHQCSLCDTMCTVEEIAGHPCIEGYENIAFEGSKFFQYENTNVQNSTSENNKENCSEHEAKASFWTDQKIEELIENIKPREAIWNFRIPLKVRNKEKNKQWDAARTALGGSIPTVEIKAKWKNLLDTYRRYSNQLRQLNKSGSAATKKIKWQFFDNMMFLKEIDLYKQINDSNMLNNSSDDRDLAFSLKEEDNNSVLDVKDYARKQKLSKETALDKIANALSKDSEN